MAIRLELKQSQSLIMTPQLQQSIKLLQLSHIELNAVIEKELAENPLLERDGDGGADQLDGLPEMPEVRASGVAALGPEPAPDVFGEPDTPFDPQNGSAMRLGIDAAAFGAHAGGGGRRLPVRSLAPAQPGEAAFAELPGHSETLHEHLQNQLNLIMREEAQRLIGLHLIDMIDEAGYLRGDLAELAERLNAPLLLVEETLSQLQRCAPPGVGARNLTECLKLQLEERGRLDPMIAKLLEHLDLVAAHDYVRLSRLCGADEEDLHDMLAEIRTLNPKPGLQFGSNPVVPVVPDVFVRATPDGGWQVELNSETLPRLLINRNYLAQVRPHAKARDKRFLSDCLNSANWLIKSLDQRAQTILKVAEEIVRRQEGFFRHGIRHLKPMVLRDIAEAIAMHESTVSRATAEKYMATPRGLFAFKYFFSSAIAGSDTADAHSSEAVRHRIRQLINSETPDSVLSDDQIVDSLRREGVDIARRTVAKYRDILGIPSSRERRRARKAAAAMAYSGGLE